MMTVPASYLGVWQRTLLRTSEGVEDRTTRVFWMQTRMLHADIRVPDPEPQDGAGRARLAGFAGLTQVRGERCQWHRLIDFHPNSGQDIGRMQFINSEEVHERALDDSYLEVWQRLPDSRGETQAQWLRAADKPERHACLLLAGDYFLFAADRPEPLSPGVSLETRLSVVDPSHSEKLLAFELSFGRIREGSRPWRIDLSSLPGRAGQALVSPEPCADLSRWPCEVWETLGVYPPKGGWLKSALPSDVFSQADSLVSM
ncbi:hypothetical protein [Mangrovitalea sediminis]|uniref:hypothetical protein n=1 Tax=Mangrovitalea sediminis TaxID=1982043 RepID=UPI000BE4B528|nr:hypothetical protein [Mangrovitalea sediminis]